MNVELRERERRLQVRRFVTNCDKLLIEHFTLAIFLLQSGFETQFMGGGGGSYCYL